MTTDVIKLLPDSVANQIAAGEVIQRPASVIKELVENAVDAGATSISIIIKDGGRTLIQVIDNGCGMSPTDARMAFERHATSKISQASDLFSLHTMGFRGEALPSIAAVAQIDMRTMRKGDTVGSRLLISESQFESQEPASCVPGTNLMVKNIFFHMPARRKFLKKDSIELGHIMREFEKLALVNTNIDFTLVHNDVTLHQFMASSFKERIGSLFGKNAEQQLASINTETSLVKISGFIAMPRYAKRRGANQFFFVNGRNMRHPLFHKAVLKCYEQLISADSQPSYFINFEVEPESIDVNIHPQKHEIKFEHEQAIFQILTAAIKETLGKTQAAGALDFDADEIPDIPLFDPSSQATTPAEDFEAGFNPFSAEKEDYGSTLRQSRVVSSTVPRDWNKLYEDFERRKSDSFEELRGSSLNLEGNQKEDFESDPTDALFSETEPANNSGSCIQIALRYIASPSQSGLMLVSQHRAHLRVLYDRFYANLQSGNMSSQQLIFPEDLDLSPAQGAVLSANSDKLSQAGFAIEHVAESHWSITAVPAMLHKVSPGEALLGILESLEEESDNDAFLSAMALSLAKVGAISAGTVLSNAEMDSLLADLFRCDSPDYTPDGKLIISVLDSDELLRRFEGV